MKTKSFLFIPHTRQGDTPDPCEWVFVENFEMCGIFTKSSKEKTGMFFSTTMDSEVKKFLDENTNRGTITENVLLVDKDNCVVG